MEVEIYTDETYFENWRYIGIICLFVPTKYKEKFVNELTNLRCPNRNWFWNYETCNNENKCSKQNHIMNNSEIYFYKFHNFNIKLFHNQNCINNESI